MIWIVTDHPQTKDDLHHLIAGRGYPAEYVDCAHNVPNEAKFRRPMLLVLDCALRESFNLVTAMRTDPVTQPIPLVMFSAADKRDQAEALARGADAFILKQSLDWAELLTEIERLAGPPQEL